MSESKNYKGAFALLTSLFFMWGFITVLVDSLVPRLKDVFELSYAQAIMVQFAFFGAYFVVSIPASYLLSKIGYKKGIVLGLVTMALACLLFYPASEYRVFGLFITAYFILAAGMTVLQVAANPYVTLLGSEEGAASRLNLSQAFNSVGTFLAPMIGAAFLLSDSIKSSDAINTLSESARVDYLANEAQTVQSPFMLIAGILLALALVFAFVNLPKLIQQSPEGGYSKLLSNPRFLMGMLGIFVYVGAEVSIGSYLVNYFLEMNLDAAIMESDTMRSIADVLFYLSGKSTDGIDAKAIVGIFVMLYWGGAMIGRFVGSVLMKTIAPGKVLMAFGALAITCLIISLSTTGFVSMWSILAVGLFNSIMFPTIFSLALEGLDNLKAQASGMLCMMIVGGAAIPLLTGFLADSVGLKLALAVMIICYAYIAYYGFIKKRVV